MSLVLSFDICEGSNCNTLKFTETTGAYSTSNTSGWGAPNMSTGNAVSATLTITTPSGDVLTPINMHILPPSFPSEDFTQEYSIPLTSLGENSSITDGVWSFLYTVVCTQDLITVTYTQRVTQGFYCQVDCCVKSMFKNIDVECDCSKDQLSKAAKAYLLLKGLKYSANAGDISKFNSDLALLQKMCLNSDCNNCK